MYPPLSPFNANPTHPTALAPFNSTVDIPVPSNATPVVPAKRKRSTTTVPGSAQQQHNHLQQLQQSPLATLAPRSYSVFGPIQHPPSSASSLVQPTPIQPAPPSQSAGRPTSSATAIQNSTTIANAAASAPTSASEDIHCICGLTDDDGCTIACDDCQRWSHMLCFDIQYGKDPPEWRCWECAPRPVNRERARERQRIRLAAQMQGRLGPIVGTQEAQAWAQAQNDARQRKRRERKTSAMPGAAPPLSASHSGGGVEALGGEEEHIDIEEDWRGAYVSITEDLIPHPSTRQKLRQAAQNWRGVTALSPEEPEHIDPNSDQNPRTKVVPLPSSKDDVAATVRPPSYGLQTTIPIANEGLIAPFTSTVIPSAQYLADPLNGYAQMGMPKPHVHLVPPPLSVALDARMAGNEARFIRSGCRPNAVLRPVLCPPKQKDGESESGAVKFAVYALRDLKASEEVVLSWEWDDGAVVHQLPALIEEGLRSGAGPSKMTPHHIERLRLQMQSIVESLKSSFVTCACGNAARDCAVRLMEAFAEGGVSWLNGSRDRVRSPKVSMPQNNAQMGPTQSSPPQQESDSGQYLSPHPLVNQHPKSTDDAQDLSRYMNAKTRARLFGPLVGAERGVRTHVVGGPYSGGMLGVKQVNGDRWDRYGELDIEGRKDGGVPEVRVEKATPTKGKSVMRGLNGTGLGITLGSQSPLSMRPSSPLRSSMEPAVGTPTTDSEEEATREESEEKMPPRMRKRWIQQRLGVLKNEYPSEPDAKVDIYKEGGVGLGLRLARRTPPPKKMEVDDIPERPSPRMRLDCNADMATPIPPLARSATPSGTSSTPDEQGNTMDVDAMTYNMSPPPQITASTYSRVSPRLEFSSISASISTTPIQAPAPSHNTQSHSQRTQGRSSLFSLLNDQPLSPIHSSKYLAQVMNPPVQSAPSASSSASPAETIADGTAVLIREYSIKAETGKELQSEPEPEPEHGEQRHEGSPDVMCVVENERSAETANPYTSSDFVLDNELRSREPTEVLECEASRYEPQELTPTLAKTELIPTPSPTQSQLPERIEEPAGVEPDAVRSTLSSPPPITPSRSPSPALVAERILFHESRASAEAQETTDSPAPSVRSPFHEPSPEPVTAPSRMSSLSPPPVSTVEGVIVSHASSPSPAPSVHPQVADLDNKRSSSPASSRAVIATHEIHDFQPPALETPSLLLDIESPALLFKEELMQAAAELARGDVRHTPTENAEDATQKEEESEVKMLVDDMRSCEPESPRSPLSIVPLERRSTSGSLQPEEKHQSARVVDNDVHTEADVDAEMRDVDSTHSSSEALHQTRSPLYPPREAPSHSPVWPLAEPDSYNGKHVVLGATSNKLEPIPAIEAISVVDHAAPSDTRLTASPTLLRAPSPSMSIDSSVAIHPTPTPPPIAAASDNEHETDRVQRQERAPDGTQMEGSTLTSTVPSEPPKIRRSMADYRQRKRKQREEEAAAKAALASPTSPTSPLQHDLSTSSNTIYASAVAAPAPQSEFEKIAVDGQTEMQNDDVRAGISHARERALDTLECPEARGLVNNAASTDALAGTKAVQLNEQKPSGLPSQEVSQREPSPKREALEEHVYFSQAPESIDRELTVKDEANAPSPTSVKSRDRLTSPQPEEDGEILVVPLQSGASPTASRLDTTHSKAASLSQSAPPSTSFSLPNPRSGRSAPPTQPRSFRDDRLSPPRHPPTAPSGKKPPGRMPHERGVSAGASLDNKFSASTQESSDRDRDKKADTPPAGVRRASTYAPTSNAGSSSAPPAPWPIGATSGLRGPPPSGPRALRAAGPAKTQLPAPPRGPLLERVERDRSRDQDRDRDKDRDRDRERDRDRDRQYDRYSPPRRYGRGWSRGRRR